MPSRPLGHRPRSRICGPRSRVAILGSMASTGPHDVELTVQELRVVARYAVERAEEVLALFEEQHPDDRRPRAAIHAAWTFVYGAGRSKLQRITAIDAHRAAKDASNGAA